MGEITQVVTDAVGDYGLYAVFLLMLVDAVLPAASEIVMLYAGAVAAGAFAGQSVTLFGERIESTPWAYIAMASAGTIGYLGGSMLGWALGRYGGRPYLERHGRWLHVTPEKLDRAEAWFTRYGDAAVLVARVVPGDRGGRGRPWNRVGALPPRLALCRLRGPRAAGCRRAFPRLENQAETRAAA